MVLKNRTTHLCEELHMYTTRACLYGGMDSKTYVFYERLSKRGED